MKKHTFIISLFILLCALNPLYADSSKRQDTTRIMSYNIRIGIGMDNQINLNRIATVIRQAAPDIVLLQEVDSVTDRVAEADQIRILSDKTQMHGQFGFATYRSNGKYGIGLLSKEKPVSIKKIQLPGAEEPRLLLIAEFKDYVVCCTHFSLNEYDRQASARIVLKEIRKFKKPVFLGGDFNASPDSKPISMLRAELTLLSGDQEPTFPANNPSVCLDYIWSNRAKQVKVVHSRIENEPMASDHRPVIVDIEL